MHYRIHNKRTSPKLASFSQKSEAAHPYSRPGEDLEDLDRIATTYRRQFPPAGPEEEALFSAIVYLGFRLVRYTKDQAVMAAVEHPTADLQAALITVRGLIATLEQMMNWLKLTLHYYQSLCRQDACEVQELKGQKPTLASFVEMYTDTVSDPAGFEFAVFEVTDGF